MGPEYDNVRSPEEYWCSECVITEILHIYYSFSEYEEELFWKKKKLSTQWRKIRLKVEKIDSFRE